MYRPESSAIPPGWTSNPSAPPRRLVLAALATLGFLTAGFLALYQTGVISTVWEPFFGDGSKTILDSNLSRWFPVPDAALGAAVYFVDAMLEFAGGEDRWKSHPWFVLANGATAIALGLTAITLLIVQPLTYGNYCTLCMLSAFISINLVGPTMEEVLAALQYLGRKYTEPTKDQQLDLAEEAGEPDHPLVANEWDALGLRLRHLFGAAIGLWLMASPAAIGFAGYSRADMRLTGPIVFTLSVLAVWPATRWFARLNAFAGFWLMIGGILLQAPHMLQLSNILFGAVLVALAVFPGNTARQIGNGWIGILGPGSDVP
jgi:uncharacterized membrane protein